MKSLLAFKKIKQYFLFIFMFNISFILTEKTQKTDGPLVHPVMTQGGAVSKFYKQQKNNKL